jgi:drug/metabolite transporter (DMT)-like permease
METIAFLVITPLYFRFLKQKIIVRKDYIFFLIFGFVLFAVNMFPLTAIVMGIPIALVTLLLYIHPVYTMIIGRIWFGEKITPRKFLFVLLALAGVILLFKGSPATGNLNPVGLIMAVLAGIAMSLWVCFGRAATIRRYTPFDILYWSEVAAVILLILSAGILPHILPLTQIGNFTFGIGFRGYMLLILLALISTVAGHTLFFYGVEKVEVVPASILALFEPVTAIILSFILFRQPLTGEMLVGGAMILAASILFSL